MGWKIMEVHPTARDGNCKIIAGPELHYMTICTLTLKDFGSDYEEMLKAARLIETAPKLLEALKKLLSENLKEVPRESREGYQEAWKTANAAIEQATGELTGFCAHWEGPAAIVLPDWENMEPYFTPITVTPKVYRPASVTAQIDEFIAAESMNTGDPLRDTRDALNIALARLELANARIDELEKSQN